MNRSTIAVDRAALVLLGVILIAAGVGAIAWWVDLFTWLPTSLNLEAVHNVTREAWWPWAIGAAGLLLLVAGLRWMVAHLPDRGTGDLTLPGSGAGGRLRVDPGPVAQAAAQALAATPGVRSATGKIERERGQLVAHVKATIEAGADLRAVAAASDQVAAELGAVLGRSDLHCLIDLKLATRTRSLSRAN